jgi:hypothetical protein
MRDTVGLWAAPDRRPRSARAGSLKCTFGMTASVIVSAALCVCPCRPLSLEMRSVEGPAGGLVNVSARSGRPAARAPRTSGPALDIRTWMGQVVIMKGPDGEPVECVCLEGSLSTCFNPGP